MGVIRIFSCDGGGVRGPIVTPSLVSLEKDLGPLLKHFHFAAGTSTGGLITTGLSETANGPLQSALQLHDLYMNDAKEIFDNSFANIFMRAATNYKDGILSPKNIMKLGGAAGSKVMGLSGLLAPKHNPQALSEKIWDITQDNLLSDIKTNLILTTYDLHHRKNGVHKSWKARDEEYANFDAYESPKTSDYYLHDLLLATTAAPSFFPPHPMINKENKRSFAVDGGVWANNPAQVALSAARKIFGNSHDYLVVSFGTGNDRRPIPFLQARMWGKLGWAAPAIDILMDGSAGGVDYHLHQDPGIEYVRFDTDLKERQGESTPSSKIDDASDENMNALLIRGERLLKERETDIARLKNYFSRVEKESLEDLLAQSKDTDYREKRETSFATPPCLEIYTS